MSATTHYADWDDVLRIAQNLRFADANEIYNVRHKTMANPESLAESVMGIKALGGVAMVTYGKDGEPIACFGASENWSGMWSVFMFATDRFPEVSLSVTRYLKKRVMPLVKALGARRGECMSAASHIEAHAWLEVLGAKRESVSVAYGANGEDYYCYSWINEG